MQSKLPRAEKTPYITFMCIRVCVYVYKSVCVDMYVYEYTCVYVYVCVCECTLYKPKGTGTM